MKVALLLLLALASAPPSALAQTTEALSSPPTEASTNEAPPARPPPLDARAYWARFDAEQAARQARLDSVDVRTPKIVTLSLLMPAATLLLSAAFYSLAARAPAVPLEAVGGGNGGYEDDRHVSPANYWLAGVGGVLALGAIGTGIWWRQRVLARRRIIQQLDSVANGPPLRAPTFAVRAGAEGVGLVLRGRL